MNQIAGAETQILFGFPTQNEPHVLGMSLGRATLPYLP